MLTGTRVQIILYCLILYYYIILPYIVPSASEPPLKGFLVHFKTLPLSFMRKAIPRFIITITVRIVGFSTIYFIPFLLSHLPLPGVFSLTSQG